MRPDVDDVVLLGVDLHYKPEYFDEDGNYVDPNHFGNYNVKDWDMMHDENDARNQTHRLFHQHAAREYRERGKRIRNATRTGTMLDDIYEHVSLEDVLRE
jgi:hypothetical protein